MLSIGPYTLRSRVLLAPMAGITDLPFRHIVRQFGVGMTVAEMTSAKPALRHSRKSRLRRVSIEEPLPRAVQILGCEPTDMANAAARYEDDGAGLVDINMGCPAKKVFNRAAGSALLADEARVKEIVEAVVSAVNVPVTLKIRTGISRLENNAVSIAKIAEQSGIQSLVVHGRSRACLYKGEAEYESIRQVKAAVSIPVIANGDIDCPIKARDVLSYTGADGIMIGRAALGNPWLPAMISEYLEAYENVEAVVQGTQPPLEVQRKSCLNHISMLHDFYGQEMGVRIARKHIRWYLSSFESGYTVSKSINHISDPAKVLSMLNDFYEQLILNSENSIQAPNRSLLAA